MSFHVSVDSTLRTRFGLSYPVTYEFAIPSGSSGLSAQRLYPAGTWETLTEHVAQTSGYTGTEGVRFDYAANRAYVSAAFSNAASDAEMWLRIMDGTTEVAATYVGVTELFDNRQAAVTVTFDDWNNVDHEHFKAATEGAQARGVWVSEGIIAGGREEEDAAITAAQWAEIQTLVDAGYVEPGNHTYNHIRASSFSTAAEAEAQIGVNSDTIKANLTLPPQSRMGASQFVLAWIEPFGAALDPALQSVLVDAGLINQRTFDGGSTGAYAAWNNTVFDRANVSTKGDSASLSEANTNFDNRYGAGGIYHVVYHPWLVPGHGKNWNPGNEYDYSDPDNVMFAHFDHISGKDDVWYVGWGHLYAYRLTALEVAVVDDEAPPPDSVEYQAEYSTDAGATWTAFQIWTADDLTEPLDTTALPEGDLRLRVHARDPANPADTSTSDVVALTVSHVQYELEGRVDGGELGAWQTLQAWAADRTEDFDTSFADTIELRARARDAANTADVSLWSNTITVSTSAAGDQIARHLILTAGVAPRLALNAGITPRLDLDADATPRLTLTAGMEPG